jgi:hypothetical protein
MLGLLAVLSRRRPHGRALLSVLGIALGVALGYGVYLVNRAAVEDLAASASPGSIRAWSSTPASPAPSAPSG